MYITDCKFIVLYLLIKIPNSSNIVATEGGSICMVWLIQKSFIQRQIQKHLQGGVR